MNGNFLAIVKRITAQQGEAILGDPQRLKGFIRDFAKDEPLPLRRAFGRAVEEGAYHALKTAPNSGERSSRKAAIAQSLRGKHGLEPALCAEALDILEAALFGTVSAAAPPHRQQQMPPAPPYNKPATPHRTPPPAAPPVAKKHPVRKVLIAVVVLAALVLLIAVFAGGELSGVQSSWQGYASFEEFSEAVDFMRIFGQSFDEEDFAALAALGLGAVLSYGNGDIQFDFVNARKLTSRYKVPKALRQQHQYLANHVTRHFAYYTGFGWIVLYANTGQ
jgi:hypothetical protein